MDYYHCREVWEMGLAGDLVLIIKFSRLETINTCLNSEIFLSVRIEYFITDLNS